MVKYVQSKKDHDSITKIVVVEALEWIEANKEDDTKGEEAIGSVARRVVPDARRFKKDHGSGHNCRPL